MLPSAEWSQSERSGVVRPSVEMQNKGIGDPTRALATIGERGENTTISQLRLIRYDVHRALKVSESKRAKNEDRVKDWGQKNKAVKHVEFKKR